MRNRTGLVVCAAVGAAFGLAIGRSEPIIGVLVAGGLLSAWFFLYYEAIGLWLLLAGTCFLRFRSNLWGTDIATIHAPDLLLVLLFGLLPVRRFIWGRVWSRTPLDVPVLALCAIGLGRVALDAGTSSAHTFEMIQEYKVLLYYALALVVANALRDRRALRHFIQACFVLAIAAAVNLVVRTIMNPPSSGMAEGDIYYALQELSGGSGNILVYWALCCGVALLVIDRFRVAYAVLLAACLGYFMLMFHRHMYLGAAFAIGAVVLLSGRLHRHRALRLVVVGLSLVLVATMVLLSGGPTMERYIHLTVQRAESLKGIGSTDTVSTRLAESQYAMDRIKESPVLGIGFAKRYRPEMYGRTDLGRFIHNAYLWMLLKMGILGLAAFLWLTVRFLRRTLRLWKDVEDPFLRAVALGSAVAFMGLLIMNLGAPYFVQDWGTAAVALGLGVVEAIFKVERLGNATRGDVSER